MTATRTKYTDLTATAAEVVVGDQVRQYPGDPWFLVDRIVASVALIDGEQVATVALHSGPDILQQLSTAPLEIRRAFKSAES